MRRALLLAICVAACEPAGEGAVLASRDSLLPALGDVVVRPTDRGHEFHSVSDLLLLDSLLVVSEPTQIRAFRWDGSEAWRFGREGDGPREFRRITDLEPRGDSIAVFDPRARRVSILSADGTWIRSLTLDESLLLSTELVPLGADRFGLVTISPDLFDMSAPSGLVRIPQTLLGVRWADGSVSEVLALLGEETIREVQGGGVTNFRALFGLSSHVFPLPDGIGVAEGLFLGYEAYSLNGTLERRVSATVDLALRDSLVAAEWEAREAILGPEPLRSLRDRSPVPSAVPAADRAVSSEAGEVWLRRALGEYRRFVGPGPHSWAVFAPGGEWIGHLTTPIAFTVVGITDDFVLGVRSDELDVEHPEIRRRPAPWLDR